MAGFAIANQLIGNGLRSVDGNGEAQASTRTTAHQRINPHHLTIGIEQRPSGVTGVDGGIGLDQIQTLIGDAELGGIAVGAADDPQGDGVIQAKGVTHRDGPVPHFHRIGITQRRHGQRLRGGHAHHGQISHGIGANHRTLHGAAIHQPHRDPRGPLHHVSVGEDQAISLKDHPCALTAFGALTRPWHWHGARGTTKELTKHRIHQEHWRDSARATGAGDGALGVDANHCWPGLTHGLSHKRLAAGGGHRRPGRRLDCCSDHQSRGEGKQRQLAAHGSVKKIRQTVSTVSRSSPPDNAPRCDWLCQ